MAYKFLLFITKKSHPVLWNWEHELSYIEALCGFFVNAKKYHEFRKEADRLLPHRRAEERDAWAAHAAKTHPGFHSDAIPKVPYEQKRAQQHFHLSIANAVLLAIVAIILLFLLARPTKAEPNLHLRYSRNELAATFGMGDPQITPIYPFQFDGSNFLKVNCITGCSASSGFTDNSTYTVGTSAINVIGAYFTSGADPACTTGNACRLRADASSNLRVNCVVGCSASAGFADNSAFTAGTTPISITGGWFATSPTACTTGNACAPSMTSDRKMFVQAFQGTSPWVVSASGNFGVTQQTSPWVDNITQWNSVALGSPSAYGTSPGAVNVPGVNAFITNTPTVTANAGTNLNTSALQLDATGAKLNLAQASTTSGQTGPLAQCAVTTSAPSYTTAQTDPLSCNTSGGLRVDGSGVTQPISAASLPLPSGAATSANQCGAGSDCSVVVDAKSTGVGPAPFVNNAVTSAVAVDASPGNLYSYFVSNPNASTCVLEFFNTASVTLGTTTPIWAITLFATPWAVNLANANGIFNFSTALDIAAVTAYNGSTTCATGLSVSLGYK